MAKRRNKKAQEETLVDLAQKSEQAQDFYSSNQNLILGGLFAAVLLFGGFYLWNSMKNSKVGEAIEAIAQAERMFERDSFAIALSNPGGGSLGFLDIADQYSGTTTGNLANYYAGVSYLQLGQFNAALSYLNDYSPDGSVLPITYYGVLGDVHSEKGDLSAAESNYKKAIAQGSNDFLVAYYMKKLGLLYEHQGNGAQAKATFEDLRKKYPNSPEGQDIEKYISRVNVN